MQNSRLGELQAGIKISWRNINNLQCADNNIVMVEIEEELKSLWMRVKEEIGKASLKISFQTNKQTKIMASGLITSEQVERGKL